MKIKSKNKILKLTIILILIFIISFKCICSSSITDNEASAINALKGNLVCCINDGYQVRYFKANIIKNMKKDIEVISIGSSHLLTLSNDSVRGEYINLSVGGANLQDRLNILGLLDLYDVKYKKIIYEIDIASFLPTARTGETYSIDFKPYGDYFFNRLIGLQYNPKPDLDFNKTYVNKYLDNELWNLWNVYDEKSIPSDIVYYSRDASIAYPKHLYELQYKNRVKQETDLIKGDKNISKIKLNDESVMITSAIMQYFANCNVEVVILLIPRPPHVYLESNMMTSSFLYDLNNLVTSYYNRYNVKVLGSFNPFDINITDDDYYDALHIKPEVFADKYVIGN